MPSASAKVDGVREFVFLYTSPSGERRELRMPVCLASCPSSAEMSHRMLLMHKLPCYLQKRMLLSVTPQSLLVK